MMNTMTTEPPTTEEPETVTVWKPTPTTEQQKKPYYPYDLSPYLPRPIPYRHKRQDDQISLGNMFQDQAILVALQNENACNPVLRASANSIIERY